MQMSEITNIDKLIEQLAIRSIDGEVNVHIAEEVELTFTRYADVNMFKNAAYLSDIIVEITGLRHKDFFHGSAISGGGDKPLLQHYIIHF